MTIFEVHNVFVLKDGKTVFAGSYSSGAKTFGTYRVSVDGKNMGLINVREEMVFPAKRTTDIALCTFDDVSLAELDVNRKIVLTLQN
ncbi:hypothetical protein [Delftia acidovorans]|uniref:Uncharacterized protein n=1 Tax=Delftia acidovorans TaxID=80866 RepID=A0AAJ2VCD7_DELAC|nr:hypothetical protein [Delftia acidovorans]MDX4957166.1 hypothetical protein [Delftia acidovorans]